MWQKLVGRAFVVVLTTCVAGCSLVQPPDSAVSTEDWAGIDGDDFASWAIGCYRL